MKIQLVDCEWLTNNLSKPHLVILDIRQRQAYEVGHLPGSRWVDHFRLIKGRPPVPGLAAEPSNLTKLFQELGITEQSIVLAYDDEGGAWAGRLLWTLALMGHQQLAYLNGGFLRWSEQDLPLSTEEPIVQASLDSFTFNPQVVATKDEIFAHLQDPNWQLWDTRSKAEYQGLKPAGKAGHLPGACHYEWLAALGEHGIIRPLEAIRAELKALGVVPEKTIIPYCHSHHRSAFAFLLLSILEFPHVKAYAGSFCEWSLDPSTPVERPV